MGEASVAPGTVRAGPWTGWSSTRYKSHKYLGIWFQEDGRWDHHALRPSIRCTLSVWPTAVGMCPSPTRVHCSCYRTFVYSAVTYGAGSGTNTQLMRERIGGSQEGRARHLGTTPMDCSCDALYGDTGLMAWHRCGEICWHDKSAALRRQGAGSSVLDFSYTGGADRQRWELIGPSLQRRLSTGYRSR
jgi:hypothetical protein